MSWFEEQIKLRKKHDNLNLADAMEDIAASVLHRHNTSFGNSWKNIKNALDEILCYYHIKTCEIPDDTIDELYEQMDSLLSSRHHASYRKT